MTSWSGSILSACCIGSWSSSTPSCWVVSLAAISCGCSTSTVASCCNASSWSSSTPSCWVISLAAISCGCSTSTRASCCNASSTDRSDSANSEGNSTSAISSVEDPITTSSVEVPSATSCGDSLLEDSSETSTACAEAAVAGTISSCTSALPAISGVCPFTARDFLLDRFLPLFGLLPLFFDVSSAIFSGTYSFSAISSVCSS